ncbi:hypothetical protein ACWGNU_07610 [Paenibacillus lautus]
MAWREVIISYYRLMISPRSSHIIQYQPVRLEVIKERKHCFKGLFRSKTFG